MTDHIPLSAVETAPRNISPLEILWDEWISLQAALDALRGVAGEASAGVAAIAAERQRQKDVEGWTPEHDDMHYDDQLACAAICYLRHSPELCAPEAPPDWPWDECWWKPKDRRADLVRAGALIAAEIDRLDRQNRGKDHE